MSNICFHPCHMNCIPPDSRVLHVPVCCMWQRLTLTGQFVDWMKWRSKCGGCLVWLPVLFLKLFFFKSSFTHVSTSFIAKVEMGFFCLFVFVLFCFSYFSYNVRNSWLKSQKVKELYSIIFVSVTAKLCFWYFDGISNMVMFCIYSI